MYEVCVELLHGFQERVLPSQENKAESSHENISGYEWILSSFGTLRSTVNTLTM
jgi:hypothetical protein